MPLSFFRFFIQIDSSLGLATTACRILARNFDGVAWQFPTEVFAVVTLKELLNVHVFSLEETNPSSEYLTALEGRVSADPVR